jgi:hypothetical protein
VHRHYGLRKTKPPATDGGPLPSDAWSGRAIVTTAPPFRPTPSKQSPGRHAGQDPGMQ